MASRKLSTGNTSLTSQGFSSGLKRAKPKQARGLDRHKKPPKMLRLNDIRAGATCKGTNSLTLTKQRRSLTSAAVPNKSAWREALMLCSNAVVKGIISNYSALRKRNMVLMYAVSALWAH